jgi:hypothetical protein
VDTPRISAGFGAALGFGAGVFATIVAAVGGATANPVAGLVVIAVAVGCVSAVTTVMGSLLVAGQCWALYAGFLLGRKGDIALSFDSLRALAVLVVVALLVSVIAAASRAYPHLSAGMVRGRAAGPSPLRS